MIRSCLVAAGVALLAGAASAATTPEDYCQAKRGRAAARYKQCEERALVRNILDYGRCVTRYAAVWTTLQARTAGSGVTCDSPRFVDNGDGTVTDRLTALQWEKKTDDSTIHDQHNAYSWSPDAMPSEAAGTVFTTFLATLNSGACFAGQCDWRLPTRDDPLAITAPTFPACDTSPTPCIDPIFGPTLTLAPYWSGTTYEYSPLDVWYADFQRGRPGILAKAAPGGVYVRAVRGGL